MMAIDPKKQKMITSWSFSRWRDYEECPFKAKLKHIDKMKEPPNPAMDRGNQIHKDAEAYLKGEVTKLAPELKLCATEFRRLRAIAKKKSPAVVIEDQWAFRSDWSQTTWNDWNECWVRIKLDFAHFEDPYTMVITDWKSGKYKEQRNEEYVQQLELYALPALLLHPHVKEVYPRLAYTDEGFMYPHDDEPVVFTPADVPRLKKLWATRTKRMLNDKTFAPRPGNYCRWCHFRKGNGGPCKF